jgi:hypothetical protein
MVVTLPSYTLLVFPIPPEEVQTSGAYSVSGKEIHEGSGRFARGKMIEGFL